METTENSDFLSMLKASMMRKSMLDVRIVPKWNYVPHLRMAL